MAGGCRYTPAHLNTKGCAIGRFLSPESAKVADECQDKTIRSIIKMRPELIPGWMRDLGVDFLGGIQSLHDTEIYWLTTGLSHTGHIKVQSIKDAYGLEDTQDLEEMLMNTRSPSLPERPRVMYLKESDTLPLPKTNNAHMPRFPARYRFVMAFVYFACGIVGIVALGNYLPRWTLTVSKFLSKRHLARYTNNDK